MLSIKNIFYSYHFIVSQVNAESSKNTFYNMVGRRAAHSGWTPYKIAATFDTNNIVS